MIARRKLVLALGIRIITAPFGARSRLAKYPTSATSETPFGGNITGLVCAASGLFVFHSAWALATASSLLRIGRRCAKALALTLV